MVLFNYLDKELNILLKVNTKGIQHIKIGIWIYLILLIFEGALRKWVLPSLSNPLLLVRDPIAVWLLFMASKHRIIYSNAYTKFMLPFTILCVFIALIFGHQNLFVAAFGARITLLHFPLVFLIGKVLTLDDVVKIGKFLVYLTIPMTILIIVQFYSPQSAWINRGVGGNIEGGGFSGAQGYFRPPATFSFISGTAVYFPFAACFIFYFLFYSSVIKKYVVYISLICLLLSIPFSISRSNLFAILITFFFAIFSFSKNSKKIARIISGIIVLTIIVYVASKVNLLGTSIGVFLDRFTSANEQEGGLDNVFIDRVLSGLISGIVNTGDYDKSFFGYGIGYGTNFASKLLTNGETLFLVDEAEWGRIIGELGPLLGILLVFIRAKMTLYILKQSYIGLANNQQLPWLLMGFGFITLLQGSWSTPTTLGFYVMGGGLTLAAFKKI